ncbi:PEP-CTERM protein-sorting domain-containing protein [Terrimicrobium sacchariphilum]|uniref:PEP-CTERM protein-sorting domain-containing protein n=1 Tax=Terrimicrobium sacchariphilum TaxID=690879 RepID=A0A146GFQ8_TERSA|nr:autotransporter-associated beta strand repeat-containing protein [Terrimicrobium sacchariphilum]GAT35447.1 PEP-CTERM protein-sorting domain-containing protein [Terrimicrobium sacchariphilum]
MKTSLMSHPLSAGNPVASRRHLCGILRLAALAAVALAPALHADTLTWDSGGASPGNPLDGSGTWNTSSLLWSNGLSDAAWVNTTSNIAVFGNNNGAAGTVTLGEAITAGGITFNTPGSGAYTISGSTLTLGSTATVTTNASAAINSVIAGSAGLTKAGAGTLTLSGTNTYTGGTVISGGLLVANINANLGDSSSGANRNLTMLNGAAFQWTGTSSGFNRNWILGAGTTTIQVAGTSALLSNGTISFTGSGPRTLVLSTTSSSISTLGGAITDGAGGMTSVTKNGSGIWTLTSTGNTYSGETIVNAGTLSAGATNAISVNSTVRVNTGATLRFDAGTQTIANLQDGSGGGGTLAMNIAGTTALTVQSGSFSGVLKDQSAGTKILALSKTTSDTLILTGSANTYSGGTTVSGGTLLINNASGNALGTGAVIVNAGALGGSGFTAANITVGNGSGIQDATITPGGGGTGTFTTSGSISLLSDAVFAFELNGASGSVAADKIVANGVAIDSGATFSFTLLGGLSGLQVNDEFKIIDNTGAGNIAGQFSNLVAGGTYNAGGGLTFSVSGSGGVYGNDLVLTVATVPEPSTWGLLAAGMTVLVVLRQRGKVS